jgi:hypothetical protein
MPPSGEVHTQRDRAVIPPARPPGDRRPASPSPSTSRRREDTRLAHVREPRRLASAGHPSRRSLQIPAADRVRPGTTFGGQFAKPVPGPLPGQSERRFRARLCFETRCTPFTDAKTRTKPDASRTRPPRAPILLAGPKARMMFALPLRPPAPPVRQASPAHPSAPVAPAVRTAARPTTARSARVSRRNSPRAVRARSRAAGTAPEDPTSEDRQRLPEC